eukprot:TRINITY_DN6230_c0_g1_i13.p1 TRINITY_DN6230_c0_g1~~TRINITY_DN6230_c0_g1_i13.p1  ORF type:complete len:109 (-),score=14.19 TRINITY_DN6230_c0_g1_i13:4-330(-)
MLKQDGRWILYGLMGGAKASNLNFGEFLGKRLSMISTTLRSRSNSYKSELISRFSQEVIPGFDRGLLKPIVYKKIDVDWQSGVDKVREAHNLMESNQNVGKILLNFTI